MMSHRKEHHKILGMREVRLSPSLRSHHASRRSDEAGYALVALIALMTLLALFAMAAAPSIVQQSQREREKEAIFRGEEVAEAIRLYYSAQVRSGRPQGDPALPTEIDQLVEGVPVVGRTKKLQILRLSAARDPLSGTGKWRLVKSHSPEMTDFVRDLMIFAGNIRPATSDPQLKAVEILMAPPVIAIGGLSSSSGSSGGGLSGSSSGPFIGVSSSSEHDAVLTYYGIEHHDRWVFTPLFR
jgi:type II secretory pathway pseudopilin PulG